MGRVRDTSLPACVIIDVIDVLEEKNQIVSFKGINQILGPAHRNCRLSPPHFLTGKTQSNHDI